MNERYARSSEFYIATELIDGPHRFLRIKGVMYKGLYVLISSNVTRGGAAGDMR